jgi:hypothetical protein
MDLPLSLKKDSTFVTGVDELRQDLYLLLKEPLKSWYQSCKTGSRIALHSADVTEIKLEIQDTLKQLKGIEVVSVDVDDGFATIRLNYNGRELEENFELLH